MPNAPNTRFLIASITKQFTAALILRLAERGLIDLQASVTDYHALSLAARSDAVRAQ